MKILIGALALTFALPAFAQSAPAPAPAPAQHQGHGAGHTGHGPSGTAGGHQHHDGQHHGAQHHEGMNHGQMGCCADRDGNGRMDCCDAAASGGTARPAAPAAQPQAGSNR